MRGKNKKEEGRRGREKSLRKNEENREQRKKKKRKSFAQHSLNSPDPNFSPTVGVSIITVTEIKHSGNMGNFFSFFFVP